MCVLFFFFAVLGVWYFFFFFPLFFSFLFFSSSFSCCVGWRANWFDFSLIGDLFLLDEWFIDFDLYSEVNFWWGWFDQQDDEVVVDDWGWAQDNYCEDLFIEVEVSDLVADVDVCSVSWVFDL